MADVERKYYGTYYIAAILLAALFLRLWGINHQIYTDENKVVTPSVLLAQGKQTPLLYPKGSYYPHFYHYVLGGVFIIPAALDMQYPSPDTSVDIYTLLARIVTALLGTCTIYVVYKIGMLLRGPRLGYLAALFLAFLPLHVKYSHYAHVDIPLTLTTLAAIWASLLIWKRGNVHWYVIAGILTGISGATHYTGFVVGIALLLSHALRIIQGGSYSLSTLFSKKILLGLLLIPISFAAATPYTLIRWKESYAIYHQLQLRGTAGDLGYTRPDFIWPLTTVSQDWGLPFTVSGIWWEFDPLIVSLALLGIVLALRTRSWGILLVLGGSLCIMYLAIIGRLPLYAIKRLLPIAPLVVLFAALGVDTLLQSKKIHTLGKYAITICCALLVLHNMVLAAGFDAAYAGGSTHSQAVAFAEMNIPHGSTVLQHTPIRLLDWNNPDYTTVRLDEVYANFNAKDPEVSHDRAKPLEYWMKEKGVEYVAMDSRIVDRYFDPTSIKLFPETTASYQAFYTSIRTRGKLIFKITPTLWHSAGPRVEIYDVRNIR